MIEIDSKKIIIGVIIGITLILSIRTVYAENKKWDVLRGPDNTGSFVIKIIDDDVNCYILGRKSTNKLIADPVLAISCVKRL